MLHKFLRQTPQRRGLLLEAALGLILARLALRLVPFRRLKPFFNRPVRGPEVDGPARQRLRKEVVWAILRTAKFLPGKMMCFPRGIVAQAMLRRRGVATTLYYGVTTGNGNGSTAHVWVQDGAQGVVGHRDAEACHILARYPEAQKQRVDQQTDKLTI
jgi:hypothetical protein